MADTASAPNQRGRAATSAYVARGEKKTPAIRDNNPFEPSGTADAEVAVLVIRPPNRRSLPAKCSPRKPPKLQKLRGVRARSGGARPAPPAEPQTPHAGRPGPPGG